MGRKTSYTKCGNVAYAGAYQPAAAIAKGCPRQSYDSQMTSARRDGAAQYFYETFLGCALPTTPPG